MSELPGSGYIETATRTEAEMKVALEQLHDVIAEVGSKAPATMDIGPSGVLGTPLSSMVLVRSETYSLDTADALTSIDRTDITQGRIVILKNSDSTSTESAGQHITIAHGTSAGNISLTGGSGTSFILCADRMLAIIYSVDQWVELWRSYGRQNAEDKTAERTNLGLGTASVETTAESLEDTAGSILKVGSTELEEGDVLKVNASGNIVATPTSELGGGTSSSLGGIDSDGFIQTDPSSSQTINDNLSISTTGDTTLTVVSTLGGTEPGISLVHNDGGSLEERASLLVGTSSGLVRLGSRNSSGTSTASMQLNPVTEALEFSKDASNWMAIVGAISIDSESAPTEGSFTIADGTTNLLIQWGGVSSGSDGQIITFPTAFKSGTVPYIIGGGYLLTQAPAWYPYLISEPSVVTNVKIERPESDLVSFTERFEWSSNYLAIGIKA